MKEWDTRGENEVFPDSAYGLPPCPRYPPEGGIGQSAKPRNSRLNWFKWKAGSPDHGFLGQGGKRKKDPPIPRQMVLPYEWEESRVPTPRNKVIPLRELQVLKRYEWTFRGRMKKNYNRKSINGFLFPPPHLARKQLRSSWVGRTVFVK
jgi:hypothetical protein